MPRLITMNDDINERGWWPVAQIAAQLLVFCLTAAALGAAVALGVGIVR